MNAVHLTCACNTKYLMPLCVMLASVVDHFSANRELVIHIVCGDSTAKDRDTVRETIRQIRGDLTGIELHWYAVDPAMLDQLPLIDDRFSRDIYARFFIPDLLPRECERAIFLDCDLVVLSDLAELFDSTASSPKLLHAVRDMGCPFVSSETGVSNYKELGIPADAHYFNAGVLVLDLKQWRERSLTSTLLEYGAKYREILTWQDQEILNAVLANDWAELDPRWNQCNPVLSEDTWLAHGYSHEEWMRLRCQPHIVHYTGPDKPWLGRRPYAPRRCYFFHYLQKTAYRNAGQHFPLVETILGPRSYYRLWKMCGTAYHRLKHRPQMKLSTGPAN